MTYYFANILYLMFVTLDNCPCFYCRLLSCFQDNLPGTQSECQTDWIQTRTYILFVLIWIQTVCKGYLQMTKFSAGMQRALLYSI